MTALAPVTQRVCIPAMTPYAVDKTRQLESAILQLPQHNLVTRHLIHAGVYHRTLLFPVGVLVACAFIKRSTTVIISGDITVFIGDDSARFTGYHVLPASAGRKQAMLAHEDTELTMLFATNATTVEEAEAEFTDDTDILMSRKNLDTDIVVVTGE